MGVHLESNRGWAARASRLQRGNTVGVATTKAGEAVTAGSCAIAKQIGELLPPRLQQQVLNRVDCFEKAAP